MPISGLTSLRKLGKDRSKKRRNLVRKLNKLKSKKTKTWCMTIVIIIKMGMETALR